jgi:NAD(P)-dependent dehydrogenase (short-subunit alcohol dehydrogenase family)
MSSSVLVTGANSGIGLAAVLELAGAGYDVVGTARTADKAERITSAAAERGVQVRTVLMDVDDADSCRRRWTRWPA